MLLLVSVGSLLTVLSLLTSRTAAMGTGDVLLLLCLRLHLVVVLGRAACSTATPRDAVGNDCVYIVAFAHNLLLRKIRS